MRGAWCGVLTYAEPFTRRRVEIRAPLEGFVREYGFVIPKLYRDAPWRRMEVEYGPNCVRDEC